MLCLTHARLCRFSGGEDVSGCRCSPLALAWSSAVLSLLMICAQVKYLLALWSGAECHNLEGECILTVFKIGLPFFCNQVQSICPAILPLQQVRDQGLLCRLAAVWGPPHCCVKRNLAPGPVKTAAVFHSQRQHLTPACISFCTCSQQACVFTGSKGKCSQEPHKASLAAACSTQSPTALQAAGRAQPHRTARHLQGRPPQPQPAQPESSQSQRCSRSHG